MLLKALGPSAPVKTLQGWLFTSAFWQQKKLQQREGQIFKPVVSQMVFPGFLSGPYQIPCHGPLRYQRIVLLTGISSPSCPTIVPPTFQVLRGCLIFFWKCWSWSRVEASKFRCYTYTLLSFAGIHVTPFDPHSVYIYIHISIKAKLKSYRPTIGRQKAGCVLTFPNFWLPIKSSNSHLDVVFLHPIPSSTKSAKKVLISIFAKSHEKHPAQWY